MGSIGNTLNTINNSLLAEIQNLSGTSTAASASTTPSSQGGDVIDFSQVSSLFSELQQLQTSNPAEFKQVLTDGAAKLQAAAAQQTDPNATAFLNNLAARFQTAADTGSLAALNPQLASSSGGAPVQGGGGHHHHHHASAAASDSDSDSTASTTNSTSTSGANLFSFLNALEPQSQQTLFSSLASIQSGQRGGNPQDELAAILNSGTSSATGQQIQNLLANFITASSI